MIEQTEIQQAAKQRKEADQAQKAAAEAEKKKKILNAEEKRKLSAQRIATVKDSVQQLHKERQSRSERPDLKTMATYQEQLRKKKALEIEPVDDQEEEPEVDELNSDDDMDITDPPWFPPESAVDTDSDGVRLGFSEDEEDTYMPSPGPKNGEDEDSDGPESEDSMVLLQRNRTKRLDKKKKKEIGKLQAEVQAHRQIAPTIHARPDQRLLEQEKGTKTKSSGKAAEIGGLQKNWKQRTQVVSQPPPTGSSLTALPPTKSRTGHRGPDPNPDSDCDDLEDVEPTDGGEIAADEAEESLEAVRKSKEAIGVAKKTHKGGTKGMGIKLKTADIAAVKHDASTRRPARPRYKNGHLPFENPTRDLLTWRNADVVEYLWSEEFPEIQADDAVQAVASSAIRNWRSAIGKHALQRLTKIFAAEPFKNSKSQRKEYVENELKDLAYIYRDPQTKSGAYRSSSMMEVYAVHQQIITKTDRFYGYPTGALSLCAAAHERALKLWQTGSAPTKETKTSFVRRPWAVRTAAHHRVIAKLSERVWNEIHDVSLLAIGSVDVDATADDSEIEDPEDLVQLSSEGKQDM
ncbi:hypothetical protein B0H34DRAFT_799197 [Crassisporium funariophilum]|nr:hypothetical protein B0H34DRAFT_799197 [Crassisporium funariophilum]